MFTLTQCQTAQVFRYACNLLEKEWSVQKLLKVFTKAFLFKTVIVDDVI